MAGGTAPYYLPGGEAMVRGGRFVTDADECCCETTTTTTGVPWGEAPCPSRAWCDANCAVTYYVTAGTGQCSAAGPADCDGSYTLERNDGKCGAGASCVWYDERTEQGFKCTACLQCALYDLPGDYRWVLTIGYTGNDHHCDWQKVMNEACPEGNYALWAHGAACDDCDEVVTVYS